VSQRDGEGQQQDMRRLQNSDPSVGAQPSAGIDIEAASLASSTTGTLDAHRVRAHRHCFSQDTSFSTHRKLDRVHAPRCPHGMKGGDFLTTDSWLLWVRDRTGEWDIGASRRGGGRNDVGASRQAPGQPQSTRYSATRRHVELGTKRAMRHVSNGPTMRTAEAKKLDVFDGPDLRAAPVHKNSRAAAEVESAVTTGSGRDANCRVHGASAARTTAICPANQRRALGVEFGIAAIRRCLHAACIRRRNDGCGGNGATSASRIGVP